MAIVRTGERLSKQWRWALFAGLELRRYCFIPIMIGVVGELVLIEGGDALSISFNTVAILFLAEVDNLSYSMVRQGTH